MKIEKMSVLKSEEVNQGKIMIYLISMGEQGYTVPSWEPLVEAIDNLDDAFGLLVNHEDKVITIDTFYSLERAYDVVATEI